MNKIFGIIGGDKRQLYLAKSIQDDGYKVYICGFELSSDTDELEEIEFSEIAEKCNNIILPLPCTKDGINIFAPYSRVDIPFDENTVKLFEDKIVFAGVKENLAIENKDSIFDYYLREELAISNAVPTAEGAISLAIQEHPKVLSGSNCLITGYGRIGKVLMKNLLALSANVDVAARKSSDMALITALGANSVSYNKLTKPYDIIFNTVPKLVLNSKSLKYQNSDTVIIELASLPGGIDRKIVSLLGIRVIDAQSLPGKYAPKATAFYIKEAIYNMMEEMPC